ncbi:MULTISPECIES: hypothetical protein [Pacificibacter]|uniref:hypothetical protein n=1 Tax=Pacificibacter TaxID=1042323 RepID=UPI001C0921A7|nr:MULTISPECIES: hypothetical protein [Pacificibacter]MBU2935693.1 hypothetical protein [Pacificibacter marinus]MDO6614189.1 hypothetical protein [Pacificibacter sp. 1_MG-2023]
MGVPDKIFTALAVSNNDVTQSNVKGAQVFSHEDNAFAVLRGKGVGLLKLGAPQHTALFEFCRSGVVEAQDDGWSQVELSQMDMALLADYMGAAYRGVAPRKRLVF